jgi:hypothetical protein
MSSPPPANRVSPLGYSPARVVCSALNSANIASATMRTRKGVAVVGRGDEEGLAARDDLGREPHDRLDAVDGQPLPIVRIQPVASVRRRDVVASVALLMTSVGQS